MPLSASVKSAESIKLARNITASSCISASSRLIMKGVEENSSTNKESLIHFFCRINLRVFSHNSWKFRFPKNNCREFFFKILIAVHWAKMLDSIVMQMQMQNVRIVGHIFLLLRIRYKNFHATFKFYGNNNSTNDVRCTTHNWNLE